MLPDINKSATRLRILITIACAGSGLLAGGDIYRYVIEVPSWRHLNVTDWAAYSRYADLGNGIFLFSIEAIGSAILLVAASVIVLLRKSAFRTVAWAVHTSTVFALGGLVFTLFAAPVMLRLQSAGNDVKFLQQSFESFHFWGRLRAVAQVLSFVSCVWALGKAFAIKRTR
jgi:hypothetical protein